MNFRGIVVRTVTALALGAVVAGCGAKLEVDRLQAFLDAQRPPISGGVYRVLPPDVIQITSQHVPELNLSKRVTPAGTITLPLLGTLDVANKTTQEIELLLIESAKDYYEEVDAVVEVSGYNSQKFYIFGQVGGRGPVPWTGSDTLLDVLATHYPASTAWMSRIRVMRPKDPLRGGYIPDLDEQVSLAGDPVKNKYGAEVLKFNLDQMVEKADLSHNILLQPGDVIYVPAHPFAWIGQQLQQFLYPTGPILEAARVPSTYENTIDDPSVRAGYTSASPSGV